MNLKKCKDLFLKNKFIIFLYLASTAFFIYQHTTGLSWDFSVHALNAKYIFDSGYYFEWNRPPLPTFLIGIFSAFGWKAAEYLFIIAVSTLLFFSSLFFADIFKIAGIKSITVVAMEVPCCQGLPLIIKRGMQLAGKDIPIDQVVISARGEILKREKLVA